MLGGNCEKMVVISSTTNEWPQNQITDEKSLMPSTSKLVMEKSQPQPQQHQQALKCPRCDSSNTKFCYYNNYSLSQPRHFCKACKRYWTRGGTLRNVPVGGGCRKNKRVKRPAAVASSSSTIEGGGVTTANPNNNPSSNSQNQNDYLSSNPLFYGLPTNPNPSEMNLPIFPGRFNSRSVVDSISGYHDLQPQLNALALGFPSGIMTSGEANNGATGFNNLPTFGSSHSSTPTTSPTMATLLASTLHQKFGIKDANHYPSLTPNFEDLRMGTGNNNESSGICMKQVKIEQDQSRRLEWNQIEQIGGFSNSSLDPSLFWNNTNPTSVSAWHDPANIGSSVTSLI